MTDNSHYPPGEHADTSAVAPPAAPRVVPAPADPAGADDPHRPRFHITPRSGWLNDPNGLIRWRGRYHLFYQHNPHAAEWGPPHWAHLVSDDLVHWEELPVALTPLMAPADPHGCWSGCAVDADGTPALLYTGVVDEVQRTCLAYGDDELVHWRKHPGNPVATVPAHLEPSLGAYRDPFVWREHGHWYQIVGTSLAERGAVLLYRSETLERWDYLHPFLPEEAWRRLHDADYLGEIWECPNLLHFGERHLLIVGTWTPDYLSHAIAFSGRFEGECFRPEQLLRFDHSHRCYYAPQVLRDGDRYLAFGWLQEQRSGDAQLAAGWSGAMSLPREVELDPEWRLRQRFAPELRALRGERHHERVEDLAGVRPLPPRGRGFEAKLRLERGAAERAGLALLRTPDGAEETRLWVDWSEGALVIDKRRSSLDPSAWRTAERAPFEAAGEALGEAVELHLYLDGSTLEVIADERLALTTRCYPSRSDADTLALLADGGPLAVAELDLWTLRAPDEGEP